MRKLLSIISILFVGFSPYISSADNLATKRNISTLQVLYVESLPKEDATQPFIILLRKFEPTDESKRLEETVLATDYSMNQARKLVVDGGFVDLAVPLLTHLTQGFRERGIDATPVFRSWIRSKEEKEEVEKNLGQLGYVPEAGPGKAQYTLLLTPYRVAPPVGNTAELKIGALLYDETTKKWVWIYYLTVKFGATGSKLGDAEAHKLAMVVINGMESEKGWVPTK